jgi:hypothetical protein
MPGIARRSPSAAFVALAATAVVACTLASAARAAWTPGGVQLSAAPLVQNEPIAVADGAGGAYVLWVDARAGNTDLYAQHIQGNGTIAPGWPADGLAVCDLPSVIDDPTMTSDGVGGALVAWADARTGQSDVYALRLTSGGKAAGWPDDGLLVCGATGVQELPAIGPDGSGGAIVAWTDVRGATSDIYAMRVLASGVVDPAWTLNGNLLCNANRTQIAPQLCSDGAGGAIVAWVDGRNGTTLAPDEDVYATRVTVTGALAAGWTANGEPVCVHATSDQDQIVVASDGAGGAFLVWTDGRNGPRASQLQDLFASRWNGAGDLVAGWTANGTPVTQAAGIQMLPVLARDGAGGVFIAWQDGRDTTTFPTNVDIYALRMTGAGAVAAGWTADGTDLTPISPTRQEDPSIVADLAGGFFVAWEDGRSTGRVFLLRVAGNAALAPGWPAGGIELSPTDGAQLNTSLAQDGAGGVILAWDDPRPSHSDKSVFAQRIGPNGEIGGSSVGVDLPAAASGVRLALRGPHPAVGRAQFALEVDDATSWSAAIYGPAGRRVWSLEPAVAGGSDAQTLSWSGRDDLGRRVPPGVYWLRVVAGARAAAMRFVFLP